MKSRLFLPMLLIVGVFLLTPILFPGKPRVLPPPAPDRGATSPSSAPAPTLPPGASIPSPAANRPPNAVLPPTDRPRADTTVVTAARTRYRLSNVGGALVGVELNDHRSLADSTPVELARPGEALLQFRLIAGRDTIPLDRTPLARESTADASVVVFRGTVGNMPLAVRWNFAPDTHRVKIAGEEQPVGYVAAVEITATGAPPGTFLLVDLPAGFRSSEADSTTDFQHLAYAFKSASGGADLIRFGSLDPGERDLRPGPLTWAVAKSKYFLVGVLATDAAGEFAELHAVGLPRTSRMVTSGSATVVVPLRDGGAGFEVYAGPQEWRRLVAMGREFETANPYGGFMQGLVQPFATIVMRMLLWMKDVLKLNYGWTLIIFGVLIRIVLWPLNQTAMRASMKMQRIQPEMAAVQKKYAGNREKQHEEMMRIYREHGMSPFSTLSGCVPMLIPMPVLFALFFVFQNTIEFRGVGFWWMVDISQKDPLYILPLAMGISMYALSWIGMRNAPPNPQAKIMLYFLPVLMTALLFNFAAGLNLYYAAQNLAALPQQWLIANERAKLASPRKG